MDSKKKFELDTVESETQAKGFLGFVSQLPFSAYNDKELVTAIAAAASKLNRLVSDEDRAIVSAMEGSRFFEIQTILCEVIPHLDTNPLELIELVQLLVEQGGTDLAANQPNAAFREWCEADPSRSAEVVELAKGGNEPARSHLVFALQALSDVDQAMACLERSGEEQTAGVLALSRMPLDEAQTRAAIEQTTALALAADTKTSCGITRAIYDIAGKDLNADRASLLTILEKLFVSEDPFVIHLAAALLNWHHKEMLEAEKGLCLNKIATVNVENKGTIDEIDLALSNLVDCGEVHEAGAAAYEIINASKGAVNSRSLESFFHKLTNGDSARLALLATDWLSKGDFFPCVTLNRAITEIDRTEPVISVGDIPLPDSTNEQIFLCRKAVGYLFIHPMTASVFSIAVLMRGQPEAKPVAKDLLFDPLLLSYSGALKDWLEKYSKDNEECRSAIDGALAQAKTVWDGCGEAREIVEFEPSESERAIVSFQKMEEAERNQEEAGKRSVFADLFTTQHLLYGDRSAFNIMTSAEELEQKTIPYSEISVSSELPTGIYFDPIGLDMMLDHFRRERLINR